MSGLGPGRLADRLARLPVVIEAHSVDIGSVPIEGYYGREPRPTGQVSLVGAGHLGRGENVDWTPEDQRRFATVCRELVPRVVRPNATSIGAVARALRESGAHSYHRAAIEAAVIDLALRQLSTDLFELSGRRSRPIRLCFSIGREEVEREGPLAAVERLLAVRPEARVKIDCPPAGWSAPTWRALAATGRIVIVDFKREAAPGQVDLAHSVLPDAWLEDPPAHLDGVPSRVALDGYVTEVADLEDPPLSLAAVNVKASRLGGPLEALAVLERCRRSGWLAYFGGMFEVGVGRRQARVLASLFTAGAWNDLGPLTAEARTSDPPPGPTPGFG